MTRVELDVAALQPGEVYPLLRASVVPRPIAWVSTRSAAGVDNLAPHSFFSVAGVDPPVLMWTSVGEKDSLRNCRDTGEFVVCVATEALQRSINHTGTGMPPHLSEFTEAGLEREPSVAVAPPRVAGSPVALECRVVGERAFGSSVVVFGQVVHIAIDEAVLDGPVAAGGLPDIFKMAPVSRLGRNLWGGLGPVARLDRISWDGWRDGER